MLTSSDDYGVVVMVSRPSAVPNWPAWNVGSVTNMLQMFIYAYAFNLVLCWDLSTVTTTSYMFKGSSGSASTSAAKCSCAAGTYQFIKPRSSPSELRENPFLFYGAEPPRCPRHFLKTRQNSPCAPRTLQGLLRLLGLSSTPSNTRPPRVFNGKTKQVGNFGPNSYASWKMTPRPYGRHTWHPCLESDSSKRVSLCGRDGNANRQYRGGSRSSLRPCVITCMP